MKVRAFRQVSPRHLLGTSLCLLLLGLTSTLAAPAPAERHRLYTTPDANATGGIEGRVAYPERPIEQILAIPSDAPQLAYQGVVDGADRRSFRFDGLPMRSYDLVVIYDDAFYEGLRLRRGESTLTDDDLAKIKAMIDKSEPFFTVKTIHRMEGTTGRGGLARGICTFLRDAKSGFALAKQDGKWEREDYRRTFKLVMLKDVGPGWQIVRTRDLYPVWSEPDRPMPRHAYRRELARIRVADRVKDVGELDLRE